MGYNMHSRVSNKANVYLNTFGGSKKSGLGSTVGHNTWAMNAIKIHAPQVAPKNLLHFPLSRANQIGGIGAGKSMSQAPADGVRLPPVSQRGIRPRVNIRLIH